MFCLNHLHTIHSPSIHTGYILRRNHDTRPRRCILSYILTFRLFCRRRPLHDKFINIAVFQSIVPIWTRDHWSCEWRDTPGHLAQCPRGQNAGFLCQDTVKWCFECERSEHVELQTTHRFLATVNTKRSNTELGGVRYLHLLAVN